ncbi:MAG: aminoacyl-tRNA hydrolase [Armatimonadaceae bacterium]
MGLGNPGPQYRGTRHNVGFDLLDRIALKYGIPVGTLRYRARVGIGLVESTPLVLAKPLTFMNLSGESVAALLRTEKVAVEDLLILVDDIHLAPGRLRLRAQGSDGGQNGLKSIVSCLGTNRFARLRIGVGEPQGVPQVDWVLSRLGTDDQIMVDGALTRALDVIDLWIQNGIVPAMNRCNAPDSQ